MKKKGFIALIVLDIIFGLGCIVSLALMLSDAFPKASYVLGFSFGFFAALLVYTIYSYYVSKRNPLATQFDERQKAIRGKCYQISFFVLIFTLFIDAFIRQTFDVEWSNYFTGVFTCICISVTVFGVLAIVHNAYTAIGDSKPSNGILFIIIGLLNLLGVIRYLVEGSLVVDGKISNGFINLICAVMMFTIGITYLVKYKIEQKKSKEEDDSDEEFKTKIC